MKSIRQRLQSRISKRGTAIRNQEASIACMRDLLKSGYVAPENLKGMRNYLRTLRADLKVLVTDQKLDKELTFLALNDEHEQRMIAMYYSKASGEGHF